jgi:hypothetical protein
VTVPDPQQPPSDPDTTWADDGWPFAESDQESYQESYRGGDQQARSVPRRVPRRAPAGRQPAKRRSDPRRHAVRRPPVRSPRADASSPAVRPAPWAGGRYPAERHWWERPIAWSAAVGLVAGLGAGVAWVRSGTPDEQKATLSQVVTYAPPIPLSAGTSYIRSRVLPSGAMEVTDWIRTTSPVGSLSLRIPAFTGLAPGSLAVSHVVIAANGQRTSAFPVVNQPSGVRVFRLPASQSLYVRYRLTGAVQTASTPGRATATITSLEVTTGTPLTSTTETVVGPDVLALACTLGTASAAPASCGFFQQGRWTVRLDGARQASRVSAQVQLF